MKNGYLVTNGQESIWKLQKLYLIREYNLPKYLHVMDKRPLKRILEKRSFHIEKSDYISMKHLGNKDSVRDGQEAIGIIAVLSSVNKRIVKAKKDSIIKSKRKK